MKTIRQEMIGLLQEETLGARELSQTLHISEREVYAHLAHLARSVKAKGEKLVTVPARCLECGFTFEDRKRHSPPGHCPRCRGTHLGRPLYHIR